MYAYPSFSAALVSLVRAGPSELFRGVAASSLRDAPYAGIFVVFYERIKQELGRAFVLPVHTFYTPCRSFSTPEFWRESCGCAQLLGRGRRGHCNYGDASIRCHKGLFHVPQLHFAKALISPQTKIQVHTEERYHGFLNTVRTIWKVCSTTV
jgi:solute carrier family 25, member 38